MFGSGGSNPYDDVVVKTTDENLTSENWELILNLCDKVNDEGPDGAHNVVASILKRLAHRNPNVQLYALTLAEALSKNCGIELYKELASRAFTQGLEKLITDRNTHDKVKRRALSLIAQWTAEFENDSSLGVMEDCYNSLKAKNFKFEAPQEAPPPTVDDDIRRKEEEELQRVLEMSMQDKGGRSHWQQYSLAASEATGASGSSSSSTTKPPAPSSTSASKPITANTTSASKAYNQPLYQSGYVPARTPSPVPQSPVRQNTYEEPAPAPAAPSTSVTVNGPAASVSVTAASPEVTNASSVNIVTRVRALHTFEPTEPGELAFEKGDVIKVVDRGYKDWWRGQLKGRTGIFPVNYVEPMPEPTVAELAKEAEQEASVFSQAVNVEKLLVMLRSLDPAKDNLADNEEIQELYRSSMALRPKIVKLIDKYSQKRADLVSMNETFLRARSIFDRMMEESLARHTGVYDAPYRPAQYPRPASRGLDYGSTPAPQTFGWNPAVYDQPGYNAFPAPAAPYGGPPTGPTPEGGMFPPGPQLPQAQSGTASYADPNAYGQQAPGQQQPPPAAGFQQPYLNQQQSYSPQGPSPYPVQQQPQQQPQQPQQVHPPQASPPQQAFQQPQPAQSQPQQPPQHIQQPAHAAPSGPAQLYPVSQDTSAAQPATSLGQPPSSLGQPVSPLGPGLALSHSAPQDAVATQPHPQAQTQGPAQGPSPSAQIQPQAQAQPSQSADQQQGPPYAFDPNTTYADPNVQAWAQYYAHGGTDLAGAVYFISVPGITDKSAPAPSAAPEAATVSISQPAQQPQSAQQQPAQVVQPQSTQLPSEPTPHSSQPLPSSFPDPYSSQAPAGTAAQAGAPVDQASFAPLQPQAQAQAQPASHATPSWVLPRHPTAAISSSPPESPAQAQPGLSVAGNPLHDGQHYGAPAQQFAGITLTDNNSRIRGLI